MVLRPKNHVHCGRSRLIWSGYHAIIRRFFIAPVLLIALGRTAHATVRILIESSEDSFCRASATTTGYGSAGALCVAGVNSANLSGATRGRFDSMLKFPTDEAKGALNQAYGAGRWRIAGANLILAEVEAPSNSIFPRGNGQFEVFWFSNDNWVEGTGRPNAPHTATGNQISWSYLNAIAASAQQQSLGRFVNAGITDTEVFALTMSAGLLSDIGGGLPVSVRMLAISPTLGFVFHSRNYGNPDWRPHLELIAEPIVPGDMNCDGRFDNFDIEPFVLAITIPDDYDTLYPNCGKLTGDFNHDGAFDNFDIDPFVDCLIGVCP